MPPSQPQLPNCSALPLSCSAGDRLAVIGPNGSGKSSLLRLLVGRDAHDTGTLTRNRGATVGWLSQDPALPEDLTVLQVVGERGRAREMAGG
jgi:ABC transport system ATP-binding/permease protein